MSDVARLGDVLGFGTASQRDEQPVWGSPPEPRLLTGDEAIVAASGQRSLRLSRAQALAGPPVTWSGLAAHVHAVLMRDGYPHVRARPSS